MKAEGFTDPNATPVSCVTLLSVTVAMFKDPHVFELPCFPSYGNE